ncbi:helix-turn-helix domain-containing protein [Paraburkholderia youngii]|uniref:helix-turn-helix domain-containing protein n=1 Tax=Paraburkholderia youngii TaxID=2782701 RepID=UPI001594C134|nr:helix-turn-helix domain-containing protein [Paraburkholderia youngii]
MSFHLVNLAWQKDLTHAPKIVLLALADFAVQSTGECFPSVRVLSAKCGLSASAVRAQIKALNNAGLVDIEKRGDGIVYRVKLGAPQ